MPHLKVETLELILAALQNEKAQTALDVGCGRGRLSSSLAQQGFSVTGVDPKTEIIDITTAAVPSARFDVGTGERMPYADRSFDAVIFLNVLHHVPQQLMSAALEEARRVLKKTGSIIVVSPRQQARSSQSCCQSRTKYARAPRMPSAARSKVALCPSRRRWSTTGSLGLRTPMSASPS